MRVLVTGAAGFLGRWFVTHHLNHGDDVWGIDDLSNPLSHWPEGLPAARRFSMDAGFWFASRKSDRDRFDRAYHFAAPVGGRQKIELDPLFNADSLRLDAMFFRWAVDHTPVAVYPSSSAVYPVDDQAEFGHHALAEGLFDARNRLTNWGQPDELYGLTKLVGEYLAWKSAGYGLSTLCIRPFSGYGEDQSLDYPVPAIADRIAKGENPIRIWGSGKQTRDFVHVTDIVGATVARLAEGISGGYATMNIGSGIPTNFLGVALRLLAIGGSDAEIELDEGKPEGVRHRYADTDEMCRYYTPAVTLQDGLRRVLEYRRAHLGIGIRRA